MSSETTRIAESEAQLAQSQSALTKSNAEATRLKRKCNNECFTGKEFKDFRKAPHIECLGDFDSKEGAATPWRGLDILKWKDLAPEMSALKMVCRRLERLE